MVNLAQGYNPIRKIEKYEPLDKIGYSCRDNWYRYRIAARTQL